MNELQKIQLDIFHEFLKACNKLGLLYFLVCGSCLGAVKYGGFIPWDDDIDIGMKREDYEVFLKEAPRILPSHLFLQNYKTDHEVPFLYSKLRNSNTTMIEKSVRNLHINHGVYIDIFPLDGYPKKNKLLFEYKKNKYKMQLLSAYDGDFRFHTRCFIFLERLLGFHKRTYEINRKLEKLLRSFSADESEYWCNNGNWQGKLEYSLKDRYGEGTEAVFEGITVRIPSKYDKYLIQKYGQWRSELPSSQKKSHHDVVVCDLNKSYKEYC